MDFRITAIPEDTFQHLFGASQKALLQAGAQRIKVTESPGYPCRVSLRDAKIGETVLLLNYTHHDEDSPYRASHAIFVIEDETETKLEKNQIPEVLRSRLLSVRAFDDAHNLIAADVCEGVDVEIIIAELGARSDTRYLHIHNAKPGCYAARVELSD